MGTVKNYNRLVTFYEQDHLGNVRVSYTPSLSCPSTLTNTLKYAVEFTPFLESWRSESNVAPRYATTGNERDYESGYDNRDARLYDSKSGRFLSEDAMAMSRQWMTPYYYVQNNPISLIDPTGLIETNYIDENDKPLLNVDDGINQTVKVNKSEFNSMVERTTKNGFKLALELDNKVDAFLFTMLYEQWARTSGTHTRFDINTEDPNFNSEMKKSFYISNIDIDESSQKLKLTWSGETPVELPTLSNISTGKSSTPTPNGNFIVQWRSPNYNTNMSLNEHKEATFAVKFNGNVATHFYPNVPSYAASHGCARIQYENFAAMIWTFSRVGTTTVNVFGKPK